MVTIGSITNVIDIIYKEKVFSAQYIAIKLGLSTDEVREIIEILRDQGLLANFDPLNMRSHKCSSCYQKCQSINFDNCKTSVKK